MQAVACQIDYEQIIEQIHNNIIKYQHEHLDYPDKHGIILLTIIEWVRDNHYEQIHDESAKEILYLIIDTKLSPQLTELYNKHYQYTIYQEDLDEYSTAKLIQRLKYQGIEII